MDSEKVIALIGKALAGGPKPAPEVRACEANKACVEIAYPNLAAYTKRVSADLEAVIAIKDLIVEGSEVDEPGEPDSASKPRVLRVRVVI